METVHSSPTNMCCFGNDGTKRMPSGSVYSTWSKLWTNKKAFFLTKTAYAETKCYTNLYTDETRFSPLNIVFKGYNCLTASEFWIIKLEMEMIII